MSKAISVVTILFGEAVDDRKIEVTLSDGTVITIEALHESWQQYGGTTDDLYITQPIAEAHNDWLHGGELPFFN